MGRCGRGGLFSGWVGRVQRLLWPGVAGVAAHEFSTDLRVEPLPESGEVGGGLHGAMIRREKMEHERRSIGADTRGVLHAKEILQAGGDPRWAA